MEVTLPIFSKYGRSISADTCIKEVLAGITVFKVWQTVTQCTLVSATVVGLGACSCAKYPIVRVFRK